MGSVAALDDLLYPLIQVFLLSRHEVVELLLSKHYLKSGSSCGLNLQ